MLPSFWLRGETSWAEVTGSTPDTLKGLNFPDEASGYPHENLDEGRQSLSFLRKSAEEAAPDQEVMTIQERRSEKQRATAQPTTPPQNIRLNTDIISFNPAFPLTLLFTLQQQQA